eukprot:2960760-Amphidinium_carterae.1
MHRKDAVFKVLFLYFGAFVLVFSTGWGVRGNSSCHESEWDGTTHNKLFKNWEHAIKSESPPLVLDAIFARLDGGSRRLKICNRRQMSRIMMSMMSLGCG